METKFEQLQIPEEIIDIIKESFYKEIACVYYILHEFVIRIKRYFNKKSNSVS